MKRKLLRSIAMGAAAFSLLGIVGESGQMAASTVYAGAKIRMKKVSFATTQLGSRRKSVASQFIGRSAKLYVKRGKVQKVVLHVSAGGSALAKKFGIKDVSSVISGLTINGVRGRKINVASDGSSFDFVFGGKAYKKGKGKLSVSLAMFGKGKPTVEKANISFAKVAGLSKSKKTGKKSSKKSSKRTRKSKKGRKSSKKRARREKRR